MNHFSSRRVAIVGFAFRLPGASTDEIWQALCQGANLVSMIDPNRFSLDAYYHPRKSEPAVSYTFAAGSLGDVSAFDAAFFGISPREAAQMDPQQRLLLEMTWEAMENGGITPASIRGSRCGVYIGISSTDYAYCGADDLGSIDASTMTGNTASIAANRISYLFDLKGPSMAVDTACSSSLVAFHQACQSISVGESREAIVGGISLHLHPFGFVGFSKASMLSKRGLCSVFDAAGDGYVRSEGGGIFVLKYLEAAIKDGNRILAVVAASGVNCDGKTSGLTVPSWKAQAELLQDVYAKAGITPDEVDYLEAHGTGTAVGDPIEARAIGIALGQNRSPGSPLLIGSVKSNLGHLETASGVAGLVKALFCLKHRRIPPTIHLQNPNPKIKFAEWNIKAVTEETILPADKTLVIGVNSFGFGGANAHVILESNSPHLSDQTPRFALPFRGFAKRTPEGERAEPAPVMDCPGHGLPGDCWGTARHEHLTSDAIATPPLIISGRSESALREAARQYAAHLYKHTEQSFYDITHSAAFHRDWHTYRAVAFDSDRQTVAAMLDEFADGGIPARLAIGKSVATASPPVFIYSGNGSQWAGMGKELLDSDATFRAAIEAVDAVFVQYSDFSIIQELLGENGEGRLQLTEVAQPTLFAIQVGITEMLCQMGVTPSAVVGHSVGEVAAAWASGALSLEQAVQVVFQRSAGQGKTKGTGQMTAVGMSSTDMATLLNSQNVHNHLTIAGVNSPRGITLAGEINALQLIESELANRNIFYKRLDLDYAFHSPAMDTLQAEIETALQGLQPSTTSIPFISTVTGDELAGNKLDAHYWWLNIKQPVQFESAVTHLIKRGDLIFIEIGPHAVLRYYLDECLRAQSIEGRVIPTLLRTDASRDRIRESFYQALIAGALTNTTKLFAQPGQFVDIPHYPWQKDRYWRPTSPDGYNLINRWMDHPLLGYRLHENRWQWENHLDAYHPAYRDHVVGGAVVFPAAGFVEMALAASALWHNAHVHELESLEIRAPLLLADNHSKTVRFSIDDNDGSFTIKSRDRQSDEPWLINAMGRLLAASMATVIDKSRASMQAPITRNGEAHYALAHKLGLAYGPTFQTVAQVWVDGATVAATFVALSMEDKRLMLHPSYLDGSFQLLVNLTQGDNAATPAAFVPIQIGRLRLFRPHTTVASAQTSVVRRNPRSLLANVDLFDAEEQLIARLEGVRFRKVNLSRSGTDKLSYLSYEAIPMPRATASRRAELPTLQQLADSCADYWRSSDKHAAKLRYLDEVGPLLDIFSASCAEQTLRGLADATGFIDPQALIANGHIGEGREHLLVRLLTILDEEGMLEPAGQAWRIVDDSGLPKPGETWTTLLEDYPDYTSRIISLGRTGLHMAGILSGKIGAHGLLQADADGHSALHDILLDPALAIHTGQAIAALLKTVLSASPRGRRLRVLEFTRYWSGFSAKALAAIDPRRCDYVIASDKAEVIENYHTLHERFPGVEFRGLGPEPGQWVSNGDRFDIVLLPGGFVDAVDISLTLTGLHSLIADDGVLVALENHPARYIDLILGGNPAWWRVTAGWHSASRLRTPEAWREILTDHGFSAPAVVQDIPEAQVGAYLLLSCVERSASVVPPRRPCSGQASGGNFAEGPPEGGTTNTAFPAGVWIVLHDPIGTVVSRPHPELSPGANLLSIRPTLTQPSPPGKGLGEGFAGAGQRLPRSWTAGGQPDRYSQWLAQSVMSNFRAQGQQVIGAEAAQFLTVRDHRNYTFDADSADGFKALLTTIQDAHGEIRGWVHLIGIKAQDEDAIAATTLLQQQENRCNTAIRMLHACEALGITPDANLVTSRGATFLSNRHQRLSDAPLYGLGRTIINEYPAMRIRLIDIDVPEHSDQAAALVEELLCADTEDEVILGKSERYVPRLRVLTAPHNDRHPINAERAIMRLDFAAPGQLKNLIWRNELLPLPDQDEVDIEVRAAGLNFRDVMYAMGLLSDEAVENGFSGPTLGMELSGIVRGVGSEVTDFAPGDEVIAFAPSSFSTRVLTKAGAVVAKPVGWSFAAAATIPTAFFTVYYGLHYLANLRQGEKVLIHGAAGGVGIAAIRLAKLLGAEVFATAGSDQKRDFVRLLGADHVIDSRSLGFADDILAITDGQGVDVVLNSLAGEAINRNLKVLRPFGRFLELGKRDFYENTKIGLRPFRNNITYFGIDADQLMAIRPDLTRRLFREMMDLFKQRDLTPLPFRAFPASEIVEAFRYMQQSKQIGKIVVTFEDDVSAVAAKSVQNQTLQLNVAATYLITGGLSGLGLKTAQWLAGKGAKNLLLLGRSGVATPEAQEAVAALNKAGVSVMAIACDVTDAAALETVLLNTAKTMPPLRGIIHAAMVIEDSLVRNMSENQLHDVLAPKVLGALHLHKMTKHLPLDFFVLYSSATTLFGNPGQGNYVAANAFLESFAAMRHAQGLPALSVCWGAIDDVGYLARNSRLKEALHSRMGGSPLTSDMALDVLEQLISRDSRNGLGVFDLDWGALRRFLPSASAPKFRELVIYAETSAEAGETQEIQRWLKEMGESELSAHFIDLLKKEVGEILRIPPEKIDANKSVLDLGMDSLMGVELITAVESRFGVNLPIMALSEGPTLARLAERIIGQLKAPQDSNEESQANPVTSEQIKKLTEQHAGEIDADTAKALASHIETGHESQARSLIQSTTPP